MLRKIRCVHCRGEGREVRIWNQIMAPLPGQQDAVCCRLDTIVPTPPKRGQAIR